MLTRQAIAQSVLNVLLMVNELVQAKIIVNAIFTEYISLGVCLALF